MVEMKCPNCQAQITMYEAPYLGPSPNDGWPCLFCQQMVCMYCYTDHTYDKHPEKYGIKSDGGNSKRKKKRHQK